MDDRQDQQRAFPDLPWSSGSRLHPWLWSAVVQINRWAGGEPYLKRIVAEGTTEQSALEGLWGYYEHGYTGTGDWILLEPTEAPREFQTWEDVHAAAQAIPVTLYTVDCPICGVDCVETESEFGAVHDWPEYLDYHMENYHHRMPRDADELAERGAVPA